MIPKILGYLSLVAIILTGIFVRDSFPQMQIIIAIFGFLCLIMGQLSDDGGKKKRRKRQN